MMDDINTAVLYRDTVALRHSVKVPLRALLCTVSNQHKENNTTNLQMHKPEQESLTNLQMHKPEQESLIN